MSEDAGGTVDTKTLRDTVERLEQLAEQKKAIAEDEKEIMDAAKAAGLEPKIIKELVRRRMKAREDVEAADALHETVVHLEDMLQS